MHGTRQKVHIGDTPTGLQMVRSTLLVPVLALALLMGLILPGAAAETLILSDTTRISGTLQVGGGAGDQTAAGDLSGGFLLLSGALEHESDVRGPVFGMDTADGTRFSAETVRVYDSNDLRSIAERRPLLELEDGALAPDTGSSFFWSLPEGHVTGKSRYSFGFLYPLEANLQGADAFLPDRDGAPPPSLIAQAAEPWTYRAPGIERSLYMPIEGAFRTIASDGSEQRFEGTDWLVSLRGNTTAEVAATGIATPFDAGATARLTPADRHDFANSFSVTGLQDFLALATGLASGFQPPQDLPEEGDADCARRPEGCPAPDGSTQASLSFVARQAPGGGSPGEGPLPDEVADVLVSIAPLLNGALFGQPVAHFDIGGTPTDTPGLSLLRFTELTLSGDDHDSVALQGTAPFAYTGGDVHHDANVLRLGPFVLPLLSIALYIIAIGAWFGSRAWSWRPMDEEQTARLRLPALLTQWGLIVVAFVLFDREVHYVLGQSLLSQLGGQGAAGIALPLGTMAIAGPALIVVLQLGLWAAASAAFGLPIAIIGRAALRVSGLGRAATGFAVGLGALFTWLLGHAVILPLLDVAFGAVGTAAG